MIQVQKDEVYKCLKDIKSTELYPRTRNITEGIFNKGDFVKVCKKKDDRIVFDVGMVDYKKYNREDLVRDGKKIKIFKVLKTRILKKEYYENYLNENYFKKIDINVVAVK